MAKQVDANILDSTIGSCKHILFLTAFFSLASNLLMLALPIFTLQVLDRVISSGSRETLIMLAIITVALLASMGLVQMARSLVLIRMGTWFDERLAVPFLKYSVGLSSVVHGKSDSQSIRDLASVRNFLTGQGLMALMDAPWSLIYLLVIFLIHPINGLIVFIGAILLIGLAIFNEKSTRAPLDEANDATITSMRLADITTRNAEVVEGMGMGKHLFKRWQEKNNIARDKQSMASTRGAVILSISRSARMIFQIAIISTGALLALNNQLTVGGIIACSIIAGRAFAPFDNAIATWKTVTDARKAYGRLKEIAERPNIRREGMQLPTPKGDIKVDNAYYTPIQGMKPIVAGIDFAIKAGTVLAVVGPSAAGKSTLAKLLVGVWRPISGHVRLDGADVYNWARDDFGEHVGYLPQDIELFSGTVKDNIARMNGEALSEAVVQAAKDAGVHEMVLQLPKGYETQIGYEGAALSGGQRQRIGLTRAFYGNPKVIILDEPNANLDEEGEIALRNAILLAKQKHITLIIISHRPSILTVVDKILVLQKGKMVMMGDRNDVLERIAPNILKQVVVQSTQKLEKQSNEG